MSDYSDEIRKGLEEIATVFSIPPARIGAAALPDLPCFCGPETRAAHTHNRGCPWWNRAFPDDKEGAE